MDFLDESSPCGPHDSDGDVGSPAASSSYSSCDGSEFDRYCSANSVLGSTSICSSVENYSELLDSLKSSHPWKGFDCFPNSCGVETPRENGQDVILMDGTSPWSRIRTGSIFRASMENSSSFKGNSDDIMVNLASGSGSVEGEDYSLDYGSGHGRGNSHSSGGMSSLAKVRTGSENSSLSVKGKSVQNAMNSAIGSGSAEEEIGFSGNLSCEDSEGEDSTIDYRSGDESRIQFTKRSNLHCSKEIVNESGNPLFMNSLVAFGAKDWDEFEQESGADGLESMSLHEDQLVQQHQFIGHENAPSVIENESDAKILRDSEVSSSQKPISEENSEGCAKFDYVVGRKTASVHSEEVSGFDAAGVSIKQSEDESELTGTPLCNSIFEQSFNALNRAFERKDTWAAEVDGFSSSLTMVGTGRDLAFESNAVRNSDSTDGVGEHLPSDEVS